MKLEEFKKELGPYGMWTNARRYSFENILIFGLGFFLCLFADVLYNAFNGLFGGLSDHPVRLGSGQISGVLIFTFLLIQNIHYRYQLEPDAPPTRRLAWPVTL